MDNMPILSLTLGILSVNKYGYSLFSSSSSSSFFFSFNLRLKPKKKNSISYANRDLHYLFIVALSLKTNAPVQNDMK
jgi:hypothetical protein